MTVGQALAERSDYRLFHNHMTIDLVLPFFDFGSRPFLTRGLQRDQFIQGGAQTIRLTGDVILALKGLRCHVLGRTDDFTGHGHGLIGDVFDQPEIG